MNTTRTPLRRHANAPIGSWSCAMLLAAIPAMADQHGTPDLSGVWSGIYTSPAHPGWKLADFGCPVGCSAAFYARLQRLLDDPQNAARAYSELEDEAGAATQPLAALLTPAGQALHAAFDRKNDPSIRCEPKGLARQAVSPLPIEIQQYADRVTIRYEQWQAFRTIHLHTPADLAVRRDGLLGRSVGRYDGATLIVETTDISENILTIDGVPHSNELHTVERYRLADGGDRLELELTLHDPAMLTAPYVMTKSWLRTPQERILEEPCEIISGQP